MNPTDSVSLSIQKGNYPVAAREFLVASTTIIDSNQKSYLLMTSVLDETAEKVSGGRVRADLLLGVWILEKVDNSVFVDYIVGVDFKGSVPECIYSSNNINDRHYQECPNWNSPMHNTCL